MSAELTEVSTRLDSVRQLGAVVTTLRGIAALRAQEGRSRLAGIRAYTDIISAALSSVVGLLSRRDGAGAPRGRHSRSAVILFCAEHGFAGAYSEHVFDAAAARAPDALRFVVGRRGILAAQERRQEPEWTLPMASHVTAVTATARSLAEALYARFIGAGLDRVDTIFMRSAPGQPPAAEVRRLLPLDLMRFRSGGGEPRPMTYLPPARLIERLVGEYFFAQLVDAAMESFASENAARFETMSAARSNIDGVLAELSVRERRLRQEAITAELLDVVAGSQAGPAAFAAAPSVNRGSRRS